MVPSVVNLEMVKTFALPLAARMSKAFFSFQEKSHEKSMYYTEVHGGLAMAATSVPLHCCRETLPSARLGEQAQPLPRLAQPLASSLCQFHSSSRRYKWKMKKKKKRVISQSSKRETWCSLRVRHEGMTGKGSKQGQLLPDWQARGKPWGTGFASWPALCFSCMQFCLSRMPQTNVFVGDWSPKQ